ncbi:MAG: LD-carboxypeptidase [Spirochaetes bacterium]|nr:LD-carboxypeptidase [Spirochaetota bacterium]
MKTKPKALSAGDLVGLISPSGSLRDPGQAEKAVAALERLGFRVKVGASCRAAYGYLAGSDGTRATDVNAFFADPAIRGIVCLKGGYGTPRILDALDYGAIARTPKVFVGYSDITGIHLALNHACSLVTFHGPMGVSDVLLEGEGYSTGSWLAALGATTPLGRLDNPLSAPAPTVLVPGRARGELIGGNLSLVAAAMGTPWELDARGKILFFEDTGERPYRIDRMLTQLRLAGKFDECAGIVLGDWNDCGPEEGKPSLSLEQVFRDVIAPAGKPVIMGLMAGHCSPTMTLPFGVEAVLDAESATPGLEMIEAALVV